MSEKRQKILYVITKSNWGGAGRYVYDLATTFKKDHEVVVALGGNGILAEKLRSQNIPVIHIKNLDRDIHFFKEVSAFFRLYHTFRMEKPDVIHLNSPKIGGLGALAARLARVKKIIFTSHGWAFNEDRSLLEIAIIKILSWITIFLSHEVIVLSEKERRQVTSWLGVGRKLHTVRNGISKINFLSRDAARLSLFNYTPSELKRVTCIGTIAELHKNKGLEYGIRAFAELNPSETLWAIIGDGEEHDKLRDLIQKLGMETKIKLVGFRKHAEELLKAFDIFLFPSLKEGFPYALLEAGAAQLPVIATHVGGISEIIEDMHSGILIKPKRVKEIADALAFYLEKPRVRRIYAKNLKQKVDTTFTLPRMNRETEAVYKNGQH